MFIKDKRVQKAVVALFFVLFLIYGCAVVKDYGLSVDELQERTSSLVTYKYLVPSVSDIITDTVNFANIAPLSEWVDRYYGVTMQLPTVLIEHLTGFTMPMGQVMLVRHLYVFLLFFSASIFFYFTSKKLTKNNYFALLGTAIFILCPRILAHSFFNIKDSVFISMFTINLYYAVCFMENPQWKKIPGLAVSTALCVNTRIVGAVIIAVCLSIVCIRSIVEKNIKRLLPIAASGGILSIIVYIAVTPVTWSNPIIEIINIYKTFSNYTTWPGSCYYLGGYIKATELPWHYLPVWIFATVPLLYLLPAAWGAIGCMKKKIQWNRIFLTLIVLLPVVYVIFNRPVLYNGWRHFYFIWTPIALLALHGLIDIWKKLTNSKLRILPWAYIGIAVLFIVIRIGIYHPYEWAYFNPWIEEYAEKSMEKDYWAVSTMNSYRYIKNEQKDDRIYRVKFPFWEYTYNWIQNVDRDQIERVGADEADTDYVIQYEPAGSLYDPAWNSFYFYPREFVARVGNLTLGAVTYALWDNYSYSTVDENQDGTLTANVNGTEWVKERSGNSISLTGTLEVPVTTGKLTVEVSDRSLIKNTELFYKVVKDGEWIAASNFTDNDFRNGFIYVNLDSPTPIAGIKIVHQEKQNNISWGINLYRRKFDVYNQQDFSAVSPIELVAASNQLIEMEADKAIDNNELSSWSSGPQEEGMVYAFTMKEERYLSGLGFVMGEEWYDYPQNLRIFVSSNEKEWTEISYTVQGNVLYDFAPIKCKYVRLVLGSIEDTSNHWRLRELILYETK